ncbi:DUF4097 family beta strand repeat-containing protein [Halostella pelagica]|uniref:DUF4097 family beta strand repeat-containing protein n=1 Tax=Halostella pelagica TaxID=2583824 RepID=UPI001081D381|nr:DUF4097 family beta strand repeat-containing protein [Halostella pelagica]
MVHTTTRRQVLAGGASAMIAGIAGCLFGERTAEETVSRSVDIRDANGASIVGNLGNVVVRGEDRDDIGVEGIKRATDEDAIDEVSISVDRSGDTIDISVEGNQDSGGLLSVPPLIDLTVTVPEDFRVTRAEADTGDINVENVSGPTNVTGDTADVDVSDVTGDVTARTDTGDQRIDSVDGVVTASADTGDVTVREAAVDEVTVDTGDVTADVRALDGDARIKTDTGDVDLTLPSSLDARIEVTVDTGDIKFWGSDGGTTEAENSYETTLGEGAHTFSVETDTGDVTVNVVD